MHYKLAPLILTPGRNASTTSDIYIAQPDSIKESLAGKLFILVEIESKKQENLKIINFLVDTINHNYYQNEKILLREKISTLKVEHIFEAALAKTNKKFSDFLQNEKIKIDLDSINIITGIIYEDSIHFVNNGRNKAYLIYRHKIEGKKRGKIKEDDKIEYKISDIIEQAGANKKKQDDEKLFTNVISGKIPKRGHFIITNEALPEYISTKQLTKIVTALPPASAVEQMKNTLSEINSYVSFLGIIVKSTTLDAAENTEIQNNLTSNESISTLNRTEETTENLLSPSGVANPKQWMKVPDFVNDKIKKQNKTSLTKPFVIKDKIFGKRKSSFSFLKKITDTLKNSLYHLINITRHLGKKITSKENKSSSSEDLNEKTLDKLKKLLTFSSLSSKKNKILLALSLMFILLFFFNISRLKDKNEKLTQVEEYNNLIVQIEKKQNQAEAFLLYNNEESAKEVFPEIKELLGTFPRETEEQKMKYQEFMEKFDLQNEKIRNVIRLSDMVEMADFKNLSDTANGENIIFVGEANKIYVADSKEKSIYTLDLNDKSITTTTNLDTSISRLSAPNLTVENKIYYLNTDSVVELSSEETLTNLSINLTEFTRAPEVAGTYSGRLYLINSDDNQIYKFSRTNDSFGTGQAWLNDKIDLSNAVDVSIDGRIYVLKSNGELIKLLKGEREELDLEKIDPPIENATSLHISFDLKFVYILEPKNNRLVIFDKTGKFIMQYTSNQFTDLKDFAVDEGNNTMYFLNENTILKANMSHL